MKTVKIDGEIYNVEVWPHSDRPLQDRTPTGAEIRLMVASLDQIGNLESADPDHNSFDHNAGAFYSASGGRYCLLGSGGARTIFGVPAQPDGMMGSRKMIIFDDLDTLIDFCRATDPAGIRSEFYPDLTAKIYPQHPATA